MPTLTYDPKATPAPIRAALELIAEDFPIRASRAKPSVSFELGGDGPAFEYERGRAVVRGKTIPQVLRALASLNGYLASGETPPAAHAETPRLDTLGLMIDCSRNGVPRPETVRLFLRRGALMGLNLFMLYTEDTYEVPSEPHIGFLRGRYTQKELKALDDYAHALGVEMIPCIQTLAHLSQMLRWWKQFNDVKGSPDFLFVGQDKTYALLEKMIAAAGAPYRSKRIHIGMDEAHGIGHGKYPAIPGERSEFDIMIEHLTRVAEITRRRGLRPMMWSDMWFTAKGGGYHDLSNKVPPEVAARIPDDVQLVYWDYYSADPDHYEKMIDSHRRMGKEPIFAPGLWTDYVWWHHFTHARLDTDAGMIGSKRAGLREAFTTIWGDDGMSCNNLSALAGLQHFAEHGYRDTVETADLARQLRGSCDLNLKAWTTPEQLDLPPKLTPTLREWAVHLDRKMPTFVEDILDERGWQFFGHNPSIYLLWQDPMVGIYDHHLEGLKIAEDYAAVAANIAKARRAGAQEKHWMEFPYELARTLELKGDLGVRLRAAYVKKDRRAMARLSRTVIPEALRRAKRAHEAHRRAWMAVYKPNGWEVQDLRWSGLEGRLRSAKLRVDDYLAGRVDDLPELAEKRLVTGDFPKGRLGYGGPNYRKIVSPSVIT